MRPHPPACSESGLPDIGEFDADKIAVIAKALGHPVRVDILAQFIEHRPRMAHEVFEGCADLAQSTVSEHLRILKKAGILFATKDGSRVWYCLRRSVLQRFAAAVDGLTYELVSID